MNVTVEVNTVALEAAMQRLRDGVRRGIMDPQYGTLPVQARLLAERCQEFTPPRNVGQGKAAVMRDLTVIYRPLSQSTFESPSIKKIVRTNNMEAWNTISPKFKGAHNLQNTRAIPFSSDWHKQNRMSRGRGRRGKGGNIGVVTLGPEGRRARSYMAIIKKRVGWAKAGWNAGIIGFGGTVKGGTWLSSKGTGGGWFQDGTAAANPFVAVGNSTSWAKYGSAGEGNRILGNAIRARARDMQSYFDRMMRVAAAKATQTAA